MRYKLKIVRSQTCDEVSKDIKLQFYEKRQHFEIKTCWEKDRIVKYNIAIASYIV